VSVPEEKAVVMKKKGTVKPKEHPSFEEMVKAAIVALKARKGSSREAILKYALQHYKVSENLAKVKSDLRKSLKRGVEHGWLKQMKGTGASGSFRLGEGVKTGKKSKIEKRGKSTEKSSGEDALVMKKKVTKEKKAGVVKAKKTKSPPKKMTGAPAAKKARGAPAVVAGGGEGVAMKKTKVAAPKTSPKTVKASPKQKVFGAASKKVGKAPVAESKKKPVAKKEKKLAVKTTPKKAKSSPKKKVTGTKKGAVKKLAVAGSSTIA